MAESHSNCKVGGVFEVECIDPRTGEVVWKTKTHNAWVLEGRDYLLTTLFKGGTRADPLYVGLWKTEESVADGWTMANNGSTWHEDTAYSEETRQEFVDGDITGTTTRQLDNDASKAEFNMNDSGTLKGAFITTSATKGDTAGSLLCATLFSDGDKPYVSGYLVRVKYTVGCADDAE